MTVDFVMPFHRSWERQRLPAQPGQVLPQIQVMPLNTLSIPLAEDVQLSLQVGFIQRPAALHPYLGFKRWQQAQNMLKRGHREVTKDVGHNRSAYPIIRVKPPAQAWFSADVAPLFVHFGADNDVTAQLYLGSCWLRPEFFKWRKSCWGQRP